MICVIFVFLVILSVCFQIYSFGLCVCVWVTSNYPFLLTVSNRFFFVRKASLSEVQYFFFCILLCLWLLYDFQMCQISQHRSHGSHQKPFLSLSVAAINFPLLINFLAHFLSLALSLSLSISWANCVTIIGSIRCCWIKISNKIKQQSLIYWIDLRQSDLIYLSTITISKCPRKSIDILYTCDERSAIGMCVCVHLLAFEQIHQLTLLQKNVVIWFMSTLSACSPPPCTHNNSNNNSRKNPFLFIDMESKVNNCPMQCLFYRLGSVEPGIPNIVHGTPQTLCLLCHQCHLCLTNSLRVAFICQKKKKRNGFVCLCFFLLFIRSHDYFCCAARYAARIEPSYRCLNLFFVCQFICFLFSLRKNRTENIFCRWNYDLSLRVCLSSWVFFYFIFSSNRHCCRLAHAKHRVRHKQQKKNS